VVSRCDEDRYAGAREGVAQERDRVLAHVLVLVDVAGDADRVDLPLVAERERAGERVAQLAAAADGGRARFRAMEDAVEVDVGDVQELHGRALKCRNGVGWNPPRLTDRHGRGTPRD